MRCQAFSITVTEEWTMKEVKREFFDFFLVFEWFFTREPKSQFLLDARRLIQVDLKKTADRKSPEVGEVAEEASRLVSNDQKLQTTNHPEKSENWSSNGTSSSFWD